MKSNSGLAAKVIERILELSADAHIQRRQVAKDSPAFHKLTGAIAAYGKALVLLTALERREEFYEMIGQNEYSENTDAIAGNARLRDLEQCAADLRSASLLSCTTLDTGLFRTFQSQSYRSTHLLLLKNKNPKFMS